MSQNDFDLDPRNKFGNEDWEADIDAFTSALNSGATVLPNGVARTPDAPGEVELTPDDVLQLKSLLSNYR